MKLDTLQTTHTNGSQFKLMLQFSKLSLHGSATTVKLAPPLRMTRDEWVAAVSLHPRRGRLALARRAAPLGRASLEVSPGERPDAMLANGVSVGVSFDSGSHAERHDRKNVARLALSVHGPSIEGEYRSLKNHSEAARYDGQTFEDWQLKLAEDTLETMKSEIARLK